MTMADAVKMRWSRSNGSSVSPQPLFFYHVPRTGGISLFTALKWSFIMTHRAATGFTCRDGEPLVMRYDHLNFHRRHYQDHYSVVATHLPFGFHERFRQQFRFATVLREPVARIVSDYAYECMRNDHRPDAGAFAAWFEREDTINRATKQLSGHRRFQDPVDVGQWRAAAAVLEEHFAFYTTVSDVDALTEALLGEYRIANVLMARLNASTPGLALDPTPFRARILELNSEDVWLYDHVARSPRLPVPGTGELHPWTIVIRQLDDTDKARVQVLVYPTATVLPRWQAGDFKEGVDALFVEAIPSCRRGKCMIQL